jgi:hypothetical protein
MLSLIAALFVSTSAHAFMVISDVDDTIKITNSGDTVQAAWSGMFKKDVFPGMPLMFKAWSNEGAQIHFVTASPTIIRGKIREMLAHYEVTYASLVLRGNLLESKLKYKTREISKIMDRFPNEDVILVGDDVGKDPEVFAVLKEKYGARVLASYIRPVRARAALAGQIPYVTTFDLVSEENLDGRVSFGTVLRVTAEVLAGDESKLFPKFAWCPAEIDETELPTETSPLVMAAIVEERIESICAARSE